MAFRSEQGLRASSSLLATVWCCALLAISLTAVAPAEAKEPSGLDATSSKVAQEAARQSIPWNKLSAQDRRIAHYVVRDHSVFVACQRESSAASRRSLLSWLNGLKWSPAFGT